MSLPNRPFTSDPYFEPKDGKPMCIHCGKVPEDHVEIERMEGGFVRYRCP